MAPPIRFYFDYISSNAYLAWARLPKIAERHGVDLELVPVLFAGFLEAHGQLGPAEVRPKARWMAVNNLRKAAELGIPLHPPTFHPFNPLLSLRISSLPLEKEVRRKIVDLFFQAVWVSGIHVSDVPAVEAVLSDAGLPGATLIEQAQQSDAKGRLRQQTDDAIARGLFGVPSMTVGDQVFWGYDDLPYLELFLEGKDPLDPAELAKWSGPPRRSAARRRFREGEIGKA